MRTQLRSLWAVGAFAVVFCVVVSVSQLAGQGQAARGRGNTPVERGKYFVDITGCHDCHSPKKDAQGHIDETRILSGRPSTTAVPSTTAGEIHTSLDLTAWTGPWGTTSASNLTPDPTTGLVSRKYTEATFLAMFRTGKKPLGAGILPPMPWEMYANLTDEDIKAVWAYLQTIKPIRNAVPAPVLAPAPPARGK
jgi:cytochrome c553